MGAIRFDSVVKDGGATVQPSEANTGLSRGYCVFSQLYRTMRFCSRMSFGRMLGTIDCLNAWVETSSVSMTGLLLLLLLLGLLSLTDADENGDRAAIRLPRSGSYWRSYSTDRPGL